jgi:hypothetical protein
MSSVAMLVPWEVLKERNARVFQNNASTTIMLMSKIKEEVTLWSLVGAKTLGNIMSRE